MDGLECSEIKKSELEYSGRIDSEYYQKKYLFYQALVEKCQNSTLGKTSTFLIGPFGSAYSTENYVENPDYRYVRGQDVKPFVLKSDEARYMAEDDFHRLEKYALKQDDILVSVVGTLGNACIVQSKDVPGIFSCKSTVVRTSSINPYFLLSYLNSKIGRDLLLRKERGAIQKGLNLSDLDSLLVPVFSSGFQQEIEGIIKQALVNIVQAQTAYKEAEKILFIKLQMQPSTPIENTVSIKSLSDSFTITGRLDAEYYQPKYENYVDALKTTDTVQTICNIYDRNFVPKADTKYSYIELANIGNSGNINDVGTILGKDLPSRARRKVKTGQVIIASVEGSLQSCALITSEYNGALCSTGFYVLDSDSINSETLLILFKSEPIQALMKQHCSGTILTAITKDELLNMPLPQIEKSIQTRIAKTIQESFALHRRSKQLLEYAKHAVEIAIEQGEEKAMEWLNEKGVED